MISLTTFLALLTYANSQDEPAPQGWPKETRTLQYTASADRSKQPMVMYAAKANEKRPLLVGLHTWSGGYDQAGGEVAYARWCIERDWHFIHPHFRGRNGTPQSMGTELVVQDIIDAVEFVKKHHAVDTDRIYLVGGSGGGYASLLMAGRAANLWAGVSAWVPIGDIRAWWEHCNGKLRYARDIEGAVGGKPDTSEKAAEECVKRSAVTYLHKAGGVNLDINAGVHDGYTGSVPFSQSLYAFNKVVPEKDRIAAKLIETFYQTRRLPEQLPKADADPLYGQKQPIFRKTSGNTRVTIFEGSHEIIHEAALNWLAQQRKGKPARWDVKKIHRLKTSNKESEANR